MSFIMGGVKLFPSLKCIIIFDLPRIHSNITKSIGLLFWLKFSPWHINLLKCVNWFIIDKKNLVQQLITQKVFYFWQTRCSRGYSTTLLSLINSLILSAILFLRTFKTPLQLGTWNFTLCLLLVTCHVSRFACKYVCTYIYILFYKLKDLFGGGSVINGANPV